VTIDRREFLATCGSCAAHLALAASAMPRAARALWAAPVGEVVAREAFGNLEKVADGVWALISTPLNGDRTTVSNGGIIAGRNAVLAIEGLNQPAGAQWLAGKARELTGRWPTHVVLTHYHGDHANGIAGYMGDATRPVVRSTERTRDLVVERNVQPADPARVAAVKEAVVLSALEPTSLDLGGKSVRIVPRGGHTDSDVSIELDDPSIVFAGDLLWNGMFPNFVDAVPTKLAAAVKAMKRTRETLYVPGHGALAKQADYERYVAMLGEVERLARKAHAAGIDAREAANTFALPESLGTWALFNPTSKAFYTNALNAWYKELKV
jgi:glyoxylase-like metal-dependent hydrolase (beta-lactamase superfamily II)